MERDKLDKTNYTVSGIGDIVNKSPSVAAGASMNISRILTELKAERERIEKAIEAVQALEKESAAPSTATASKPGPKPRAPQKKRNLTAEGRKRIAEAARRRWAAVHKAAAAKSGGAKAKSA